MNKVISRIILFAMAIVVFSCKSPQTMLNEGNYTQAMYKSMKKLRKNKTKEKYILVLEEAYQKIDQRDMDRIAFLKREGTPESKVEIADTYKRIKSRQQQIQPLLPLFIDSEGREARFHIIDVDAELIQAKKDAAEFLYQDATRLLNNKDRLSARQAHGNLVKIKRDYFANFKDIDAQINRAYNLGTNKVLFKMVNATGVPLPPQFERDLTNISLTDLNRQWLEYHTTPNNNFFYDYNITVNLKIIDVSPEIKNENTEVVKKEVEDGFDYALDKSGNVMKDTAGNDIKIKKYKTVICVVKEVEQRKVAHIEGTVDYFDNRSKQLVGTFPVAADGIFQHKFASAEGQVDILNGDIRGRMNNQLVPFPSDFELLAQAGNTLRPLVKNIINERKNIVRY